MDSVRILSLMFLTKSLSRYDYLAPARESDGNFVFFRKSNPSWFRDITITKRLPGHVDRVASVDDAMGISSVHSTHVRHCSSCDSFHRDTTCASIVRRFCTHLLDITDDWVEFVTRIQVIGERG